MNAALMYHLMRNPNHYGGHDYVNETFNILNNNLLRKLEEKRRGQRDMLSLMETVSHNPDIASRIDIDPEKIDLSDPRTMSQVMNRVMTEVLKGAREKAPLTSALRSEEEAKQIAGITEGMREGDPRRRQLVEYMARRSSMTPDEAQADIDRRRIPSRRTIITSTNQAIEDIMGSDESLLNKTMKLMKLGREVKGTLAQAAMPKEVEQAMTGNINSILNDIASEESTPFALRKKIDAYLGKAPKIVHGEGGVFTIDARGDIRTLHQKESKPRGSSYSFHVGKDGTMYIFDKNLGEYKIINPQGGTPKRNRLPGTS